MSHCLSNLSIIHPISSQAALLNSNPKPVRVPIIPGRKWGMSGIKAIAGQGRDNHNNVDLSQRPLKQQVQKRSVPIVPLGMLDSFPTAKTVQQMMDTMERIMEDPLTYSNRVVASPADPVGYGRGRTPWEIKDSETEYKMRFDMPGMTKEDVKVYVEEKMLVVKAEKMPKKNNGEAEEENGEEWSAKSYGRYGGRIALPENVEYEKIKAEVKDGVLYITIPKASSSAKIFDISVV